MTPARSALIAAARSMVGDTGATYEADVASPEIVAADYPRADEIATMSGCELVWHALMRDVFQGLDAEPYVTGQAFADLYRIAGPARRVATLETPPQPGDGIEWGVSGSAVAHVDACVVDVTEESPGTLLVSVIAGGQRVAPGGEETVKLLARTLRWGPSGWRDVGNGRPLVRVIDADAMAERYALAG